MTLEHPQRRQPQGRPVTQPAMLNDMREGKPEAWGDFFATYWRWLLGICLNMGVPYEDASDLVQEVFVKVNQHIKEFIYDPARGRFSGWLVVILGNLAVGYWRKRARDPLSHTVQRTTRSRSQTAPLYRMAGPRTDQGLNPVLANELGQMFRQAYAELKAQVPPVHWAVFQACAIDDRPAKDVAQEYKLSVSNVYCIVSRLMTKLREIVTRLLKL